MKAFIYFQHKLLHELKHTSAEFGPSIEKETLRVRTREHARLDSVFPRVALGIFHKRTRNSKRQWSAPQPSENQDLGSANGKRIACGEPPRKARSQICVCRLMHFTEATCAGARRAVTARRASVMLFDYVIVGGGSAGCLLANRLSQKRSATVLLIEAGGRGAWRESIVAASLIRVPLGYVYAQGHPRLDWAFQTTAQKGLGDRSIAYPRGRVLGGSSCINGQIYQQGNIADFAMWAERTQSHTWNWDNVRPYYARHLDYSDRFGSCESLPADSVVKMARNSTREWTVEPQKVSWPVLDAIQNACVELGVPATRHFHSSNESCVGYFQVNQRDGVRLSAAEAFLSTATQRERGERLEILTNDVVRRIVIEKSTAIGVETARAGIIRARRQVILSAGAIGSPHLLQVSGIGPAELLERHGVRVLHDLDGVGKDLHDHLQMRPVYKLSNIDTLNTRAASLQGKIRILLEYLTSRSGPLSMAPSQLGLFVKASPELDVPDLQFHFQPLSLDRFGAPLHAFNAVTLSVCHLQPTSRGTVELSSARIEDKPRINPAYLSSAYDRAVVSRALDWCRRIMSTKIMQEFEPVEHSPGTQYGEHDVDSLVTTMAKISTSIYHPVGTCAMGAVCDERLRVRGIHNLSVVDASVMPRITSGNTNSPVLMLAEKGAEMILQDTA
ncbi:Alcohol dehydrogenase, acceptor [Porphyridium purpureum]|uniref:Alcohol dehydrogenase, acceptor n=1 Tax=Porphyridium purpureum TaxID=35688 RepID=A0A5J4YQ32_PORPP|nr:Alcohol dehydrogenase, acceptor [Porphyridium purpureum]|eukprot:POR8938..scf296_7